MKNIYDCSTEAQNKRREILWEKIRNNCRVFFNDKGEYDGNRFIKGKDRSYDQRVVIELAIALLHGNKTDRALAEKILRANDLMIGSCAFNMDYILALWYTSEDRLSPGMKAWLLEKIRNGSQTSVNAEILKGKGAGGYDLSHRGFNLRGTQWHGYNDNHVAMGMSSLILGGELIGDKSLVEAGRAVLYNMRDTLQRRGLINECNDCYLPHTMYPLASIVAWAKDEECRELAQNGLVRIWSDLLGHWHPNLARKIGPSARDYTFGRLTSWGWLMLFSYVFGEEIFPKWLSLDDVFKPDNEIPTERKMFWHDEICSGWNLGFLARISAQNFIVPDFLAKFAAEKNYPFEISGMNEFGNMLEIYEKVNKDGSKTQFGLENIQYAGGPHLLTSYMEEDWGMGTADQRLLGGCPNNNWQLSYRKKKPLDDIRQQGSWYCSYTINDKVMSDENHLEVIEGMPESKTLHGPIHFGDAGRFAGMQYKGTAVMLYRPRPLENWKISSLALSLLYPKHYGNEVDELWFGDEKVKNWNCEVRKTTDIFIKDGPMLIAFQPLIAPWRKDVDGPEELKCEVRMRAEQRNGWAMVNIFNYSGKKIAIRQECDLSRIGNGFVVEVATEKDFKDMDSFKSWFRKTEVLDATFHWQRQLRYHRPAGDGQPKLDLAFRWDAWQDRIVYRAVNGRTLPEPQFECTGIDNRKLPWLTGDVSGNDNFSWTKVLDDRPQHKHGHQPLPISIEKIK